MSVTRPVVGVGPAPRGPHPHPPEGAQRGGGEVLGGGGGGGRGVGPFVVRAGGRGRATDSATERGIR